MPLQIIPVLDVQSGVAVHAVGGFREDYRPLQSQLHPEPSPLGIALAYRDVLGLKHLYLADLDAIGGKAPALGLYRSLAAQGLTLWVDAGIRDAGAIAPLFDSGVSTVIVGLESIRGPKELARILAMADPRRIVLSLDLRNGVPIIPEGADWPSKVPAKIAAFAVRLGLRRLLILDLARVGNGQGTGTKPLLKGLAGTYSRLELSAGGGVSSPYDLLDLERAGASNVLVGSTLHDGRIGREDLLELFPTRHSLKAVER